MLTDAGATLVRGWGIVYLAAALIRGGKCDEGIAEATTALGTPDDLSARANLAFAHLPEVRATYWATAPVPGHALTSESGDL